MAKREDQPPALEWATGALGALVLAVLLSILLHAGVTRTNAPPDIDVRVERVAPVASGYVLVFEAENIGDETAADVEIAATLASGQRARARLDYLAPHALQHGGLYFSEDPRSGALTLRASGYREP